MSLKINWSDRFEALSEKLFSEWELRPVSNPFVRTCKNVVERVTGFTIEGE